MFTIPLLYMRPEQASCGKAMVRPTRASSAMMSKSGSAASTSVPPSMARRRSSERFEERMGASMPRDGRGESALQLPG